MASDMSVAQLTVTVTRGNLYLSREICDKHLPGIEAVALLDRANQIMIVPLTPQSGGGMLLKIRNVRGDRVIHAQEFFRDKGYLETFQECVFPVRWDVDSSALVIESVPKVLT